MHRVAACNGQWFTIWSDGEAVTIRRNEQDEVVAAGLDVPHAVKLIMELADGDDVILGDWRLSGRPEELPMRPERL